jgi:predicted nucleic acid-binding protein
LAGLTLDSGALIAAERGDRRFWAFWKEAQRRDAEVTIPAGVLAQTWRGNNAVIARLLHACCVEELDMSGAKRAGEILARSRTTDVIDASVVQGAAQRGDAILTSDPNDLRHLATCSGLDIVVMEV